MTMPRIPPFGGPEKADTIAHAGSWSGARDRDRQCQGGSAIAGMPLRGGLGMKRSDTRCEGLGKAESALVRPRARWLWQLGFEFGYEDREMNEMLIPVDDS